MTVRKSYPLAETQFKYEKPDKKDASRYKSKKEVKRIIKGKPPKKTRRHLTALEKKRAGKHFKQAAVSLLLLTGLPFVSKKTERE